MTALTHPPTPNAPILDSEQIATREEKPWRAILRRFLRHRMALLSSILMLSLILIAVFAQQIAPFERDDLKVGDYFLPPGSVDQASGRVHYFGTDNLGRDYFTRMIYAARISLTVAFTSVTIAVLIGVLVGAVAGYYQGFVDNILMRIVDFLMTIPDIPILLIVSSMLLQNENAIPIPRFLLNTMGAIMLLSPNEARNAVLIILVLAGLGWMGIARLMRGQILALRNQPFVEAAQALGASDSYIIFRHLIPNAMAPIIVSASLGLGGALIAEAILSFLGFGIQDPIPTWGNMLYATRAYMNLRVWLPIMVGAPIFICSLAINFIGDGLRDALDPRMKL